MSVSLTGDDTLIITKGTAKRILADFGDGDVANLDMPDNLAEVKTGKNENAIIAFNASGKKVNMTIRIVAGSPDDKYFNSEIRSYEQNRAGYVLLSGEFIKRAGDGKGGIANIVYNLSNGLITKYPSTKENVNGDTESALSIYQFTFSRVDRIIA
jgi:hypothetical protein